ncbi:hypothetical protein BJ508DRAFT_307905 [Ascobolus immersus RN42]|uniref:Uncharacterized protein n=1 Tax=Ascobolus immersus RN42 TaxID=1160509 RepID=A0A3N4I1L2_ASCIM|nr:hypothetical protein BJ508DRAFT_307905 [Ascobolus immersus RN42]
MPPTADNAIQTSSDAWATLIANIAPLLVLVGEKHVKQYFKIMSKQSHLLLFAAGPIGLVTAVTTLVRIRGHSTLRRLIGRLFETKADIFQDVTGLSSGDVMFELKDNMLEQTTNPVKEDIALFYLHGGKDGSNKEMCDYWEKAHNALRDLGRHSRTFGTHGRGEMFQPMTHSVMAACVRARGSSAAELLRESAKRAGWEKDILQDPTLANCGTDTDGAVFVYGSFSEISLTLTANADESIDGPWMDYARIGFTVVCLLANLGLIAGNWFLQKDMQNTALIAIGTVLSTSGSYYVARVVSTMTEMDRSPLGDLSLFEAGFHTKRSSDGITLRFLPTFAIVSKSRHWSPLQSRFDWLSHIVIVYMVLGYLALYLGLRTSEWWICLLILILSAAASVARTVLSPDTLKLVNPKKTLHANPFLSAWMHAPKKAFVFQSSSCLTGIGNSIPKPTDVATTATSGTESRHHELVFYQERYNGDHFDSNLIKDPLFRVAFHIVLHCRTQGLVPSEMRDQHCHIPASTKELKRGLAGPSASYLLRSDWLRPDGVIQQPLDILAHQFPTKRGCRTV